MHFNPFDIPNMNSKNTLLSLAAVVLAASGAQAQSFNVDVGDQLGGFGIPANAYSAAAVQMGPWQSVAPAAGTSAPLTDVNNVLTTVTLAHVGGLGAYNANNFALTGDDAALMCDTQDIGTPGTPATYTFQNLAAGSYTLYTYAWAPDFNTYTTVVSGGSVDPAQTCGGAWSGGAHVLLVTYTVHHYNNVPAAGSISLTLTTGVSFGTCNGFQLVKAADTTVTGFCFGDGSGTNCPCSTAIGGSVPPGLPGNGCPNSLNANGANLAGSGTASVTTDSFLLTATGMPNSTCLYFQGVAQTAGGLGGVFGDGLRCAQTSVIRLGTKVNSGGTSAYPTGSDLSISVKGANAAGNVRYYQCWYRNSDPAFCVPASTFNLTNGVGLTWAP